MGLWEPCCQFFSYIGQFGFCSKIRPFHWIVVVVVQFFAAVCIANESPAFSPHGIVVDAVGCDGWMIPFSGWIFQQRDDAFAIEVIADWQAAEFAESRIDIDEIDSAVAL